jgi:hypothetical protein
MAIRDNTAAQYRYFVTNLVTNELIAEIPFKGVSYERVLTGAGTFSGNIVSSPETASLSLYESTMPGRTGLYVVRDGVCVWGGIIWSRSYNVNDRVVQVSASEFTSYFHHRRIWKTWGQVFEASLESTDGLVKVTLPLGSSYELTPNSTVRFVFSDTGNQIYNGTYTVLASGTTVGTETVPPITKNIFYTTNTGFSTDGVALANLPNGNYSLVTLYVRTNTYDYVRSIINAMSEDFGSVDFANTEIQPAKSITENVTVKRIVNGVAIIETELEPTVITGQEIEVKNVDPLIDGSREVSSVVGNLITVSGVAGVLPQTSIGTQSYTVLGREAFKTGEQTSTVVVTTAEPHNISEGSYVNISNLDLPDSPNTTLSVQEKLVTEAPIDSNRFSYTVNRPIEMQPLTLSIPTAVSLNSASKVLSRTQVETLADQRVATITTSEANNFAIGQNVTISNLKDYSTVVKYRINELVAGITPASIDYFTRSKPPFKFKSAEDTEVPESTRITISGFGKTSDITQRAMTFAGSTATFTLTTSTKNELTTGGSVTVSGLKDSYRIRSYSFSTANNIATFFTGTQAALVNHNIQATNLAGSFTVSGIDSVQNYEITSVNQGGLGDGFVMTLTTNVAANLIAGTNVEVSGLDGVSSTSFKVIEIARTNNVTTITTDVAHNLKVGNSFTYGGINNVGKGATGTYIVKSLDGATKFSYDNPVAAGV